MGTYCYEYPRPGLTVDVVLFQRLQGNLRVLLVRRGADPYAGKWALPGGYVEEMEPLEQAAARELEEETSVTDVELRQIGAFGDPGRDPRGHTVSIAFSGVVDRDIDVRGADDAREARWVEVGKARNLAFDHDAILKRALEAMALEQ